MVREKFEELLGSDPGWMGNKQCGEDKMGRVKRHENGERVFRSIIFSPIICFTPLFSEQNIW